MTESTTIIQDKPPSPLAVELPLSRGFIAIIDAEDLELVSGYNWCVFINRYRRRTPQVYAQANFTENGRTRKPYLHRLIMNAPPDLQVDHRNGYGLDCRRSNLRLATRGQNHANRPATLENKSTGRRGVWLNPQSRINPFVAHITRNKKTWRIGAFPTLEEAARAYDAQARALYEEFATLNFPEVPPTTVIEYRTLEFINSFCRICAEFACVSVRASAGAVRAFRQAIEAQHRDCQGRQVHPHNQQFVNRRIEQLAKLDRRFRKKEAAK